MDEDKCYKRMVSEMRRGATQRKKTDAQIAKRLEELRKSVSGQEQTENKNAWNRLIREMEK